MKRIGPENWFQRLLAKVKSLAGVDGWRQFAVSTVLLALAACSSAPRAPVSSPTTPAANPVSIAPTPKSAARLPVLPPAGSGRGGYYQDDGPGDHPPDGLLDLPDAVPKVEPYSATGNKPYVVFGKTYTPLVDQQPFKQRGVGSWYGKKFHGQKTSSGELYDMYKLTAAHPTLPIPSYARVTNLGNGAQVIVRINDRGPFHSSRIIDLSYTAALKLGYLGKGSGELEVERLLPDEIARMSAARELARAAEPAATEPTVSADEPVAAANGTPSASALSDSATTSAAGTNVVSGYYLQFGAFAEIANAEATRSRLMQNWDNALPPLEVSYVGVFYRLHSGPYSSRAEAALAAQKVQAQSEIKAMIVQR